MTSVGSGAFQGCSGLLSVVIGNGITSLPDYVFGTGESLKSLTIGAGVLSISNYAFRSEYSSSSKQPIKTIWLTNTPPSGYGNASGTVNYVANDLYTWLNNKMVYQFLSSIFEVDGVKYVPVSPSERTCDAIDCAYNESAEKIIIGKTASFRGIEMTVKNVNQYACYENRFTKNVDLSNDGNVGDYAFYGCADILTADIKNAGDIGQYAFSGNNAMYNAIVNNKGTIGSNAFYQNTGLKTLEIGESVSNIASEAFSGCTNLETAKIQNKGGIADKVFQNCSAMKAAILGEGITSIGQYAFDGCQKLQDVVIPDAVTSLGSYAFQKCASMTSAKMGAGLTAINEYAFSECTSLTDVLIGSHVATIGSNAFSNCSALPRIQIPQSVTEIKNYTFSGCRSLKDVIMDDRRGDDTALTLGSNGSSPLFVNCPLDSVYIGRNISYSTSSYYGYSPFYRNTSLRSVTITDKETEISPNEFYGCTNLKNVSIGDGVTTIGDWAFSGCSSLDFFAFGSSVGSIGQEAFSDCTAMTRLISRAVTPPTCGAQALDDINKWNCTLSVPVGHVSAYQQASQWKDFFFINDDASGISKLTNERATPAHIYDLDGRRRETAMPGLNIIRMSDGRTKKVVVK